MDYAVLSSAVRKFIRTILPTDDATYQALKDQGLSDVRAASLVLQIAWCNSIRDVWADTIAVAVANGHADLAIQLEVAKQIMSEAHPGTGDMICLPPGARMCICKVDDKELPVFDISMSSAVPLSSVYLNKAIEALDLARKVLKPPQTGLTDDQVERLAAALWRAEHPDQSVFDCDVEMKQRYRDRVRALEAGNETHTAAA